MNNAATSAPKPIAPCALNAELAAPVLWLGVAAADVLPPAPAVGVGVMVPAPLMIPPPVLEAESV